VLALTAVAAAVLGCGSSAPVARIDPAAAAEGLEQLAAPPAGDLAALYRLHGRAAGSLRLSVLVVGAAGRFSVSERMGSALSIAAWGPTGADQLYDLREGCRLVGDGAAEVFGFRALPLRQAARLLAGRLPAGDDDRVVVLPTGQIRVDGRGWGADVRLAPGPWRVVEVRQRDGEDAAGWRVEISEHAGSVPTALEVTGADGRWVRLAAVQIQWNTVDELPPLPELPRCTPRGAAG
jgi:hypothetical protein